MDAREFIPDATGAHTSVKASFDGEGHRVSYQYIDIPLCFDCETYSFYQLVRGEKEKRAVMWAWGIAIYDQCYIGRTWEEFLSFLDALAAKWHLDTEHRCIIWVHNLSYDFQFFRKWLHWTNVFALSSREVCYALEERGIEFRCSYILTGYSLEKVGEHLTGHSIRKLSGSIDYDIPRHPGTPLTKEEALYLAHDCLVVTAHIQEQIEVEGGLARVPLTKTGYVRRDVRKACFRDPDKRASEDMSKVRYSSFIQGLELDAFVYDSLRAAFQGGFTHASPYHSKETVEDVTSYDFASAYPSVMCSELFPITPPQIVDIGGDMGEFGRCLEKYCCVFTLTLYHVEPRVNFDHYLSESHCFFPKETRDGEPNARQLDNGRVVRAGELVTTITNVDWDIIIRCYHFQAFKVSGMIRWGRGYLPKPIVASCLKYFGAKTELKGVKGREQEYMSAKEMLNSIYGMMVMDPLRDHVPYDLARNEWGAVSSDGKRVISQKLTEEEKAEALLGYNESKQRFTYYAWGVFITAYCRKNLWRGILHFKEDYCYADTDSLKVMNGRAPEHLAHIQAHNEDIQRKIKKCLRYHGMSEELSYAKTKDGKKKELGIWEHDGDYSRFKSLGAKRYMTEQVNKKTGGQRVSITVSGVNKREAIPYIISKTAGPMRSTPEGGGDPFELFDDDMVIPPGHAGKMIPFYGDEEIEGDVRDREGRIWHYHEKSFVHMEPGGYSLSLAPEYVRYLRMLKRGRL